MTARRLATATLRGAAAVAALALLAACDHGPGIDQRCELSHHEGTDRTRVSDCELALEDGSRVRMVLIRHVAPDGGAMDADILAFRIYPDGAVERLSTADAGELMSGQGIR